MPGYTLRVLFATLVHATVVITGSLSVAHLIKANASGWGWYALLVLLVLGSLRITVD